MGEIARIALTGTALIAALAAFYLAMLQMIRYEILRKTYPLEDKIDKLEARIKELESE